MNTRSLLAALLSASLLAAPLAGCAQPGYGGDSFGGVSANKQTAGAILGGVVGGVAGSRFGGGSGKLVAVGIGTLLGAALGSAAGASLDRADQTYAEQAAQNAYGAPTGQTIRWNNPQTGNYGTYTPVRDGRSQSGEFCREYQTSIVVGGRTQQGVGTACQQPDGSWRVVS
ncbi:RT0821/Lpp0805 family surface protein [Azospirillum sp.]|uniref:RT0821/Lpp0805 family surface protein n=1 Tax=Azospirillum sp. TaxID=34012 RepID=UPI00262968E4|nr:RT0821/Lpp0805 family surface protein [Azospirillum sp.]